MATDQLTATLIGGPTVLIEIGGFRVLTDRPDVRSTRFL